MRYPASRFDSEPSSIAASRRELPSVNESAVLTEPFDVIVTLSDDSVHRIGEKAWRSSVPPEPYAVESLGRPTGYVVESYSSNRHPQPTCF